MLKTQHNCDYVVPVKKKIYLSTYILSEKVEFVNSLRFLSYLSPKIRHYTIKKDTEIQTNVRFAISLVCLTSAFMQKKFKKTSRFSMVCIRQTPIYNIIAIML